MIESHQGTNTTLPETLSVNNSKTTIDKDEKISVWGKFRRHGIKETGIY